MSRADDYEKLRRARTRNERFAREPSGLLPDLLTPAEVGQLFRVDPKTVTRWAKLGRISSVRTLGGHRRYRRVEVERLLDESNQERTR